MSINPNQPTKPPDLPKGSKSNQLYVHRQRQLKDRLKLKWGSSKPTKLDETSDEDGEKGFGNESIIDHGMVKGFGEHQFNESSVLEDQPSFHLEEMSVLHGTEESKMIAGKNSTMKGSTVHNKTYLTALPSIYDSSHLESYSVVHTVRKEEFKIPFSTVHPHLEMSQSLIEHGYEEVAENLADGKTEFCYLEPDKDNFYRYGLKSQFPAQNSVEYDDWTTISARGMLRFKQDGIELSTFSQIAKEKTIYEKLLRFKLFRTFWEWKMFQTWKRYVVTLKTERAKTAISKNLIILDDLFRDLILKCREILDKLSKETLFTLDLSNTIPFNNFIENQKNVNAYLKNKIDKSIFEIISILCQRCEDYIFEAAAIAPPSITARQYESMKIGQSMQLSHLLDAISPENAITSKVMNVMEEMKTQQEQSVAGGHFHDIRQPEQISSKSPRAAKNLKDSQKVKKPLQALLKASSIQNADVGEILLDELKAEHSIDRHHVDLEEDEEEVILQDHHGDKTLKNKKRVIQKLTKMKDEKDIHKETLSPREIIAELSMESSINIPYSIRAAVRSRCRRLLPLFRLIDYMIRDKLYDFLFHSLDAFFVTITEAGTIALKKKPHRRHSLIPSLSTGPEDISIPEPEQIEDTKIGLLKLEVVFLQSNRLVIPAASTSSENNSSEEINSAENNNRSRANSYDPSPTTVTTQQQQQQLQQNFYYMEEINLEPNKINCLEDFRSILTEICTSCSYVKSLLTYDRCARLFAPIRSELLLNSLNLDDRIFKDNEQNHIQYLVKSILHYLNHCFDIMINKEIQNNSFYLQEFNSNIEIFINSVSNRLLNTSPEMILTHLNKWKSEIVYLNDNLKIYKNYYSLFHLEYKNIKHHFVSIITMNQDLYYRLIPDLYVTHGDKFYREINSLIDKISKKFNNLDEFIGIVENYNLCQSLLDEIAAKFKYIMNIREIVETNDDNIRISDAILRQNLTLTTTFYKFQSILTEFPEAVLEENIKIYRNEIVIRYKKIIQPIELFTNYINEINAFMINDFYQPNAEEILIQLFHYKKEIENINKLLTTLDYYQKLLKLVIFEKNLELAVDESLKANIILWSSYKTLHELMFKFMKISYLDCNCENLMKEVNIIKSELNANNYLSSINDLINQNMNTSVEDGQADLTLDSEISTSQRGIYKCYHQILVLASTLLESIPLIQKLQSNTFKNEHIHAIHELLHHNIYDDVDITVGELMDVIHIKDYTFEIEQIYNQSKIQFHLEYKVNSLIKSLHLIEFQFSSDHDNKALIFIHNFEQILDSLNDSYLTFLSVKQSSSIVTMETIVYEMIKDLSNWLTWIKQFHYFQVKYLQYRTLFTSAKTARQLSPYMKYFKIIDENWRTLIRLAKVSMTIVKFFEEKTISSVLMSITSNIQQIEKGIKEIIEDQCEKYPKLYLIDYNTMIELFTNNNLLYILHLLSMNCFSYLITNIEVDIHEPFNILSIYCYEEKLSFNKIISGRSNLADFCKSIEHMINDRLERDVKELIFDDTTISNIGNNNNTNNNNNNNNTPSLFFGNSSGNGSGLTTNNSNGRQLLDDLRTGKFCEQSQILMFQVKFWSILDKILCVLPNYRATTYFNPHSILQKQQQQQQNNQQQQSIYIQALQEEEQEEMRRNVYFNLRSLLLELNDQIGMISSILSDTTNSFMMKKVSNFILIVMYYRDLVKSMMDDELNALPEKLAEQQGGQGGQPQQPQQNDYLGNNNDQQYFIHVDKAFYACQKRIFFNSTFNYNNYHLYSNNTFLMNDFIPTAHPNPSGTVGSGNNPSTTSYGTTTGNSSSSSSNSTAPFYTGPIISVEQGGFMERYGMKYQGFQNRLVLLPLVDRCFFALNQAFRMKRYEAAASTSPFASLSPDGLPFQIPMLTAQFPKSLMKGLAYEYGNDLIVLDGNLFTMNRHKSIELLVKSMIVAFRCNHLMLSINHIEKWTMESIAYFGNILQLIYQTVFLEKKDFKLPLENKTITLSPSSFFPMPPAPTPPIVPETPKSPTAATAGNTNKPTATGPPAPPVIPPPYLSILPKISFLHSITIPNKFNELHQTNHLFIPITTPFIPISMLLKQILTSYNFVHVNKMTQRIEGMIEYFISHHIITSRSLLLKLIIKAIRLVGIENEHSKINISMQLNLIIKKFFLLLPIFIQLRFTEYELRLFCNLFLEIMYNPETDSKDFYSSFYRSIEYSILLKKMIIPSFTMKVQSSLLSTLTNNNNNNATNEGSVIASLMDNNGDDSRLIVERNIITVVGACNVGKTTLIKNTLHQLSLDLQKLSGGNRGGGGDEKNNNYETGGGPDRDRSMEQSLNIYPTTINPVMLINVQDSSASLESLSTPSSSSSSSFFNIHTILSQFNLTIQRIIEKQVTSIYQPFNIHFIFHFDFANSLYLSYMLESTNQFLKRFYFHRKIKLICELTELYDLTPNLLTSINIMYLHERCYNLEDIISWCHKFYTEGTSHYYQKIFSEIRDTIIRPTILNYPKDSIVSQFTLVKQIYALISDLYHLMYFPITNGSGTGKYDILTSSAAAAVATNTNANAGATTTTAAGHGNNNNNTSTHGNIANSPPPAVLHATTTSPTTTITKTKEVKKITANYNDFDDDSIRRLSIFACIWIVGTCSSTAKVSYERWFREYFNDESQKTRLRKIFPVFDDSISIFKYNLHRVEGTIISLEWVQYDSKFISSNNLSGNKRMNVPAAAPLNSNNSNNPLNMAERLIQQDVLYSQGLYSSKQNALLVITSEMKSLAHIQAAYSHTIYHILSHKNINRSNRHANGIHLFGEETSGKKTILHYLLNQMSYFSKNSNQKPSAPSAAAAAAGGGGGGQQQSSRVNQNAMSSSECCRRWVLHVHQDKMNSNEYHASTLQKQLITARMKLSTYLYEHNLQDYGGLFIEDINLDYYHQQQLSWNYYQTHDSIHANINEIIRQIMEFQSIYHFESNKFVSLPMFYTVMNSSSKSTTPPHHHLYHSTDNNSANTTNNNHNNPFNHRLLKHFLNFHCSSEMIKDIFSLILYRNNFNSGMTIDLAKDLTHLSHSFYENLRTSVIHLQLNIPPPMNNNNNTIGNNNGNGLPILSNERQPKYFQFRENEKLLFYQFTKKSSLLWTHYTLSKLNSALNYIHYHLLPVTPNDMIRIWDRIVNDLMYRFPLIERVTDIFTIALEDAVNAGDPSNNNLDVYNYAFPSFVSILERERSIRVSNLENVVASFAAPQPDEAISYSRNCMGFYKTITVSNTAMTTASAIEIDGNSPPGPGGVGGNNPNSSSSGAKSFQSYVSPVLSTAEQIREIVFKQIIQFGLYINNNNNNNNNNIVINNGEKVPERRKSILLPFSTSSPPLINEKEYRIIEKIYRKHKENLNFWADILRFLNYLHLQQAHDVYEMTQYKEFPYFSLSSIIILVNNHWNTTASYQQKIERLKIINFHLNYCKIHEVTIHQDIIDYYIYHYPKSIYGHPTYSSSSSPFNNNFTTGGLHGGGILANSTISTEDYCQYIFLLAMENFFDDPYAIFLLRRFIHKIHVHKTQQPLGTRRNSTASQGSSNQQQQPQQPASTTRRRLSSLAGTVTMLNALKNDILNTKQAKDQANPQGQQTTAENDSREFPESKKRSKFAEWNHKKFENLIELIQNKLLLSIDDDNNTNNNDDCDDDLSTANNTNPADMAYREEMSERKLLAKYLKLDEGTGNNNSSSSSAHPTRFQLTLWLLNISSSIHSYHLNSEITKNIFLNSSMILQQIMKDLSIFHSLLCHSFLMKINEHFQIHVYEDLRTLFYQYSLHQKFILHIHDGLLSNHGNNNEKEFLSADLYSFLMESYPGIVHIFDIFPDKLNLPAPNVPAPGSLTTTTSTTTAATTAVTNATEMGQLQKAKSGAFGKALSTRNLPTDNNDANNNNNAPQQQQQQQKQTSPVAKNKLVSPVQQFSNSLEEKEIKAKQFFVEYLTALNNFIEKNKSTERKSFFNLFHFFQQFHLLYHSLFHRPNPQQINHGATGSTTASMASFIRLRTKSEEFAFNSFNEMKIGASMMILPATDIIEDYQEQSNELMSFLEEFMLKNMLSNYNQPSIFNAHNLSITLHNLDEFQLIMLFFLILSVKTITPKTTAFTLNLGSFVEYLMKKGILSLAVKSMAVETNTNTNPNAAAMKKEDLIHQQALTANSTLVSFFQQFLSNFQFSFLGYLLKRFHFHRYYYLLKRKQLISERKLRKRRELEEDEDFDEDENYDNMDNNHSNNNNNHQEIVNESVQPPIDAPTEQQQPKQQDLKSLEQSIADDDYLQQKFLSTISSKYLKYERFFISFYQFSWNIYSLFPRNSQCKSFLPSYISSFFFHPKIIIQDSLFFTNFLLNDLLETNIILTAMSIPSSSSSSSGVYEEYGKDNYSYSSIQDGKLIMEIQSPYCFYSKDNSDMTTSFFQESSSTENIGAGGNCFGGSQNGYENENGFFQFQKNDFHFFSELLIFTLLSKGYLQILSPEFHNIYQRNKFFLSFLWKDLKKKLFPKHLKLSKSSFVNKLKPSTDEQEEDNKQHDLEQERRQSLQQQQQQAVDENEKDYIDDDEEEEDDDDDDGDNRPRSMDIDDLLLFEEIFSALTTSLFQGIESFYYLLFNFIQTSTNIVTGDVMVLFYQEFMKLFIEEISYANEYRMKEKIMKEQKDIKRQNQQKNKKNKKKTDQEKEEEEEEEERIHPIYGSLASILNFTIFRFTTEILPKVMNNNEMEVNYLLFQVILDYFFHSNSNYTMESNAISYKQKYLFFFIQLSLLYNNSSPLAPYLGNTAGTATPTSNSSNPAGNALAAASSLLQQQQQQQGGTGGASHRGSERHSFMKSFSNRIRLDWKYGIIRREQINLTKLQKQQQQQQQSSSSKKNHGLNTISEGEDDVSDLGSGSERGDNEETDDNYFVEEFHFSEFSKSIIKQSFTIINQFMTSAVSGTFHYRYHSNEAINKNGNNFSASIRHLSMLFGAGGSQSQGDAATRQSQSTNNNNNRPVDYYEKNKIQKYKELAATDPAATASGHHNNNLHILSIIEKNLDEIMDWILNLPLNLDDLYLNYSFCFNPLEELIFISVMKPSLFHQTCLQIYYLYGLNLNFPNLFLLQDFILQRQLNQFQRQDQIIQKQVFQHQNKKIKSSHQPMRQSQINPMIQSTTTMIQREKNDLTTVLPFSNIHFFSANTNDRLILKDPFQIRGKEQFPQEEEEDEEEAGQEGEGEEDGDDNEENNSTAVTDENKEGDNSTIVSQDTNSITPQQQQQQQKTEIIPATTNSSSSKKQTIRQKKDSMVSVGYEDEQVILSLFVPEHYLTSGQLIPFIQSQFQYLDKEFYPFRPFFNNNSSNPAGNQVNELKIIKIYLIQNNIQNNLSTHLTIAHSNSLHQMNYYQRNATQKLFALQHSSYFQELNTILAGKNLHLIFQSSAKAIHHNFAPNQFFYIEKFAIPFFPSSSSSSSGQGNNPSNQSDLQEKWKVLFQFSKSLDLFGNYSFAFSDKYFLLLLSFFIQFFSIELTELPLPEVNHHHPHHPHHHHHHHYSHSHYHKNLYLPSSSLLNNNNNSNLTYQAGGLWNELPMKYQKLLFLVQQQYQPTILLLTSHQLKKLPKLFQLNQSQAAVQQQQQQQQQQGQHPHDSSSSSSSSTNITVITIQQIYLENIHLLFVRLRYLMIFVHLSFSYYFQFIRYPTSSSNQSYSSNTSFMNNLFLSLKQVLDGVEMIEELLINQIMTCLEHEVKKYYEYQKFYTTFMQNQVNNNLMNNNNNNNNNNDSTTTNKASTYPLMTPAEIIHQALTFINEKKIIHLLLTSIYSSKVISSLTKHDYLFLESIFTSFFTEQSLDYSFSYLLLNQIEIPQSFSKELIEEFLRNIQNLFEENNPRENLDDEEESSSGSDEDNKSKNDDDNDDDEDNEDNEKKTKKSQQKKKKKKRKQKPYVKGLLINENLISDLLFLNSNFLLIKSFWQVNDFSQELQAQQSLHALIQQHHYDEHLSFQEDNTSNTAMEQAMEAANKANNNHNNNKLIKEEGKKENNKDSHSHHPHNHHNHHQPVAVANSNLPNAFSSTFYRTNYYTQILQMKCFTSNHYYLLIQQALSSFHSKLLQLTKISWKNNKEILKQMKEHSLSGPQRSYANKNNNTNSNNANNANAKDNNNAMGGAAYKRRFGQRIVLRFQSREYDSLWAYLLLEVALFNKYYSYLCKYLLLFTQSHAGDYSSLIGYFYNLFLQSPHIYQYHPFHRHPNNSSSSSNNNNSQSNYSHHHHHAGGSMKFDGNMPNKENFQDLIHSYFFDFMMKLSQGYIPVIWLSYHDAIFTSSQYISIDEWISILFEQRKMLFDWLKQGKPQNLSIYLLFNPSGLFYALKETFATRMDCVLDKVHLHYEILPKVIYQQEQLEYQQQIQKLQEQQQQTDLLLQQQQQQQQSSSNRKTKKQQTAAAMALPPSSSQVDDNGSQDLSSSQANNMSSLLLPSDQTYISNSLGCYFHLIHVYFQNALFSGRTNMMEFMPQHAISPYGSEVVIRVYTAMEEPSLAQEDAYNCPFYLPSSNFHPMYALSNLLQFPAQRNQPMQLTEETETMTNNTNSNSNNNNTTNSTNAANNPTSSIRQDHFPLSSHDRLGLYEEERNEKQPICTIPVSTLEDREDCKLNRISLISCPVFLIPHS